MCLEQSGEAETGRERGQTQARADHSGPERPWERGWSWFWGRSPLKCPLTSEALSGHLIETGRPPPPPCVFLHSTCHCLTRYLLPCLCGSCLFPTTSMWASQGQRLGLFCSLPQPEPPGQWHSVGTQWIFVEWMHERMGRHQRAESAGMPAWHPLLRSFHTHSPNTYQVSGTTDCWDMTVTKGRYSAPWTLHLIGSHTTTKKLYISETVSLIFLLKGTPSLP